MSKELIERAQTVLAENPYDSLHDSIHSLRVWENCQTIVEAEGLEVQMDVMEISSWWHDVDRSEGDMQKLETALGEIGFDKEKAAKVLQAVKEHSFGNKQGSPESKVLYDADKLEYLSLERFAKLMDSFHSGEISDEGLYYYKKEWGRRVVKVRESLNYEFTRKEFDRRTEMIKQTAKKDPRIQDMIDGVI